MKRHCAALVLLGLLAGTVASAEKAPDERAETMTLPEVLDLDSVIRLALDRNPALKSVEEQQDQADAAIREAWADVYPQFDLNAGWNQSRNPSLLNSPDFDEIIEQFPGFSPSVSELYNWSIGLSQPLFKAGKIGAAIQLAKLVSQITQALIHTAQLDAGLFASEAYFRVLEAREGLETIEIQLEARQASLDVVQVRYDLGEATELELLQAKAALAELSPAIDSARGAVRVALINLRAVLDLPDDYPLNVAEVEEDLPDLPTYERALEFAFETRPEFRDLELRVAALDKQKRITRADGYPQFDLAGAYGHTARETSDLDNGRYKDWFIGIGLSWSFFDGGRRNAQVAQLDSQQDQLEWQIAALFNQVKQEVEGAITDYATALSRLDAAEVSAKVAREANRVAQENYAEGVALQTDLLAAQEREISAEVVRVQSYYSARSSAARLARAVGLQADEAWGFRRESEGEES
jgi:outer membrane protein